MIAMKSSLTLALMNLGLVTTGLAAPSYSLAERTASELSLTAQLTLADRRVFPLSRYHITKTIMLIFRPTALSTDTIFSTTVITSMTSKQTPLPTARPSQLSWAPVWDLPLRKCLVSDQLQTRDFE